MAASIGEMPWLGGAIASPGGGGLLSWLAVLWQARRSLLEPADREALNLIELLRSRFGDPLLEAQSVDDLHDRIDNRIDDPALTHISALLLPLVQKLAAHEAPRVEDIANAAEQVLGASQVATLLQAEPLLQAWIAGNLRMLAALPPNAEAALQEVAARNLSLFGPEVPVEIARALAGSSSAALCLAAVQAAMVRGLALDPWLARAIVERLIESVRIAMRFFAAIPEAGVPENVIPREERLDLPSIEARHAKARAYAIEQLQRERARRDGAGSAGNA